MTHPSSSMAPPAPVHSHAHAIMTRLDGGRVGYLKTLLVVREHPTRLSRHVPRTGGGAILGTVDHLTCTHSRFTKKHSTQIVMVNITTNNRVINTTMHTSFGNTTCSLYRSIYIVTDVTTVNLFIDARTSERLIGPGSGPTFGEGLKLILCVCEYIKTL
jgi:hypothetical protein